MSLLIENKLLRGLKSVPFRKQYYFFNPTVSELILHCIICRRNVSMQNQTTIILQNCVDLQCFLPCSHGFCGVITSQVQRQFFLWRIHFYLIIIYSFLLICTCQILTSEYLIICYIPYSRNNNLNFFEASFSLCLLFQGIHGDKLLFDPCDKEEVFCMTPNKDDHDQNYGLITLSYMSTADQVQFC